MNILFIADGRSPIAINWIRYFVDHDHEVHLLSTYASRPEIKLASYQHVPVPFSAAAKNSLTRNGNVRKLLPVGVRTKLRQWIVPFTLSRMVEQVKPAIARIKPDLIHAMRIPYEGMLAAMVDPGPPLLISVWGNDFTLHAPSSSRMAHLTRYALNRADALHSDCQRDISLAQVWGFSSSKASIVLPGGGGVQLDLFYPPTANYIRSEQKTVINPRGMRAYVCNHAFFQSIPLVLERLGATQFVCPAMETESKAKHWIKDMRIEDHVALLPMQTRKQMADLFRKSHVVVSPSIHDGTPNTLLEAMACGCFPVVGDIESLREWITPGVNGMLVDPRDPAAIADATVSGLENRKLRDQAIETNLNLVAERADYQTVMPRAEKYYYQIVKQRGS